MAFDKFKKIFMESTDDARDYASEEDYYENSNEAGEINTGNKMILLEPRAYSESQQIAD